MCEWQICRHCVYQMVDHKDFRCPLCREPFGVDAIRKRLEINRSAWESIQSVRQPPSALPHGVARACTLNGRGLARATTGVAGGMQ